MMIDLSNYSCDKCAREFSRHCDNCFHTASKPPTRFKPKTIFARAIKEVQELDAAMSAFTTPKFRKPTPPPSPPTIKEFKDYTNVIILPKHDTLDSWKDSHYLPYKDEILVGYNDIKIVYKLGDGIHKWNELSESTLEEVIALGYIYHSPNRYRIKVELIPTRTMR